MPGRGTPSAPKCESSYSSEERAHVGRKRHGPAGRINSYERSSRRDQSRVGDGVRDQIIEHHTTGARLSQARSNTNDVVVASGRVESRRQLGDGESDPGALHFGVAQAARSDEVGPSDFAPHEIVRVIDDTHLVGFGVPNAKLDVVVRWCGYHNWGVIRHEAKIVRAGLFVKRARRR
jgi:hypothetical protein